MPSSPARCCLIALFVACAALPVRAQAPDTTAPPAAPAPAPSAKPAQAAVPRFQFGGYAVINYYHFDWQTDSNRRDAVDLERLVLEPSYQVTEKLRFDAEVEIEHGGTGAEMEFDPFEEFGEFEQEIDKGGEIVVEKLQATYALSPGLSLLVGRLYVPVGLITSRDEPDEYFTNVRNESEATLIPSIWHETGIGLYGRAKRLRYQVLLVTGLDGTGFSSANWVKRGHQTRFETVNAEDPAAVGRLDVVLGEESSAGISGYVGNSTGNRPKPDLDVPAYVTILDAHAVVTKGPFGARGLVMYGHLQNADLVSAANANLSNNLNVKRTPVGSAALAWFVEAGYDVLHSRRAAGAAPRKSLILFGRYDWYDSMYRVTGNVFDNPRWQREAVSAGFNWIPDPHFIVKAAYERRLVGLPSANRETTVTAGVAALF